jgi:hypothetical protein
MKGNYPPWRWKQHLHPKRQYLCQTRHNILQDSKRSDRRENVRERAGVTRWIGRRMGPKDVAVGNRTTLLQPVDIAAFRVRSQGSFRGVYGGQSNTETVSLREHVCSPVIIIGPIFHTHTSSEYHRRCTIWAVDSVDKGYTSLTSPISTQLSRFGQQTIKNAFP